MKINKIKIKRSKLDANFKLYFFLKELNGSLRLSETEISSILEVYFANETGSFKNLLGMVTNLSERFPSKKKDNLLTLLYQIVSDVDLKTFIFALKLIQIKPLLLAEAKLTEVAALSKLKEVNQLSIKYDTISKGRPYYTRVNGALLSLLFFSRLEEKDKNFISESTGKYINALVSEFSYLKSKGLEPNQMFMLMFSESINQAIISDAGSSYEDRIFNILIGLGIPPDGIKKKHDEGDSSTEFDFFFNLKGKTFGIGAKRTLRERYKQFIKTAQMSDLDVMIEITLGLDLSEEKAKSIRSHGVYLFVADEIYKAKSFLKGIDGIYPASKLNIKVLMDLAK